MPPSNIVSNRSQFKPQKIISIPIGMKKPAPGVDAGLNYLKANRLVQSRNPPPMAVVMYIWLCLSFRSSPAVRRDEEPESSPIDWALDYASSAE